MASLSEEEIDDILYCARQNELEELKGVLLLPKNQDHASILSQVVDPHTGNSALHYACGNGHLDVVQYLLSLVVPASTELKAYVNRQNDSGNTALHWSALNGHLEIAKMLLESGADASVLNSSGHDAVFEAEMNDKQEVAEYLLKESIGLEQAIGGEQDEDDDGEDETMEEGESSVGAGVVMNGIADMNLSKSDANGTIE